MHHACDSNIKIIYALLSCTTATCCIHEIGRLLRFVFYKRNSCRASRCRKPISLLLNHRCRQDSYPSHPSNSEPSPTNLSSGRACGLTMPCSATGGLVYYTHCKSSNFHSVLRTTTAQGTYRAIHISTLHIYTYAFVYVCVFSRRRDPEVNLVAAELQRWSGYTPFARHS